MDTRHRVDSIHLQFLLKCPILSSTAMCPEASILLRKKLTPIFRLIGLLYVSLPISSNTLKSTRCSRCFTPFSFSIRNSSQPKSNGCLVVLCPRRLATILLLGRKLCLGCVGEFLRE